MSDEVIFETERLVARSWHVKYAPQALEVYGDSHVTRHLDGITHKTESEMRDRIDWIIHRNESRFEQGLGSFPVFLKADESYVGTALIKNLPDGDGNLFEEIEIGWHLGRRHWGQGYATEFGRSLLEIGFAKRGLACLHAVVAPENEPSRRVALRLGMSDRGQTSKYYGQLLDHFVIDHVQWKSTCPGHVQSKSG